MLLYLTESHFHYLLKEKKHYHFIFAKEYDKNLERTDYCILGKKHTDV